MTKREQNKEKQNLNHFNPDSRVWAFAMVVMITAVALFVTVVLAVLSDLNRYAATPIPEPMVVVRTEIVKECDCVCAPCDDLPLEKCEFEFAYIAIKDGLYHDKGDIYVTDGVFYYGYDHFCPTDPNNYSECLSKEVMLESGFFKPY